jgi:hypothetical protein
MTKFCCEWATYFSGSGIPGNRPLLPFEANLPDNQGADVKFIHALIQKIPRRVAQRKTMVSAKPNAGELGNLGSGFIFFQFCALFRRACILDASSG